MKPHKILFLDDNADRHAGFTCYILRELFRELPKGGVIVKHVWTADEAWDTINKDYFDTWFLDHDLGDFGVKDASQPPILYNSGSALTSRIRHMFGRKRPKNVVIHSWNPEGARYMVQDLQCIALSPIRIPFGLSYDFKHLL